MPKYLAKGGHILLNDQFDRPMHGAGSSIQPGDCAKPLRSRRAYPRAPGSIPFQGVRFAAAAGKDPEQVILWTSVLALSVLFRQRQLLQNSERALCLLVTALTRSGIQIPPALGT